MENNVIRFTEMSKIATNPKLGLVLEKLPFLKKSFATLSEFDKYVGHSEGEGKAKKREDLTILFDSKDKGKVIPKNSCLWNAIEVRNEAELCNKAMEEVSKLYPDVIKYANEYQNWINDPNKKSENNPLSKAATVISDFCMNNTDSKYINYMFLQCTGTIMGAASGKGYNKADIIHNQFLRDRFLKNRGNEGGDIIAEVYLMGYLTFILGKDLFGAINGTKSYTEQLDNSGLLFDKNNSNSKIVRIVRELQEHPYDADETYMPTKRISLTGKRKYLKDEKTGERFNQYALALAKGDISPDDFKKKVDDGEISMEEAMAAKEDFEACSELWSIAEAERPIQVAGQYAAQQFNNAKSITLKLPNYHVSDTVKMWVTDPTQMIKDKENLSPEQYIAFLNEYNKYSKDFARAMGVGENAKSLDDKVAGKDGDDMNFGDTIGSEDANLTGVEDDEELKESFTNVVEALKELHPNKAPMFKFLVALIMYPQAKNNVELSRIAGEPWYIEGRGKPCVFSSRTKSEVFTGAMAKWSDGEVYGLGNDYLIEQIVPIINNRAYIEKKADLVEAFDSFINSLKSVYNSLYGEPLVLNNIESISNSNRYNVWEPKKLESAKGEAYYVDTPTGAQRSITSASSTEGYVQLGNNRYKADSEEGKAALAKGGRLVTKKDVAKSYYESLFADIYDMSKL